SADTWKGTRIFNKNLEFLVRPTGTRPGVVLLMLEGLASGRVELFDEAGKVLQARELTAKDKQFQPASLTINPGAGRYCRVRLTSPDAQAWHVQHDAATQVTMYDPGAKNLDNLYPRAYGYLKPGTQEIYIRYEAVG